MVCFIQYRPSCAVIQSTPPHINGLKKTNIYLSFMLHIPCVLAVCSVPYHPHHRIWPHEATAIWSTAHHCGKGKESLNGFLPAIKCFSIEMTPITYTHNSLVSTSHMAPPPSAEHQEVRSYYPPRRQRARGVWSIVLMIIK